jgi:hypothetical protein
MKINLNIDTDVIKTSVKEKATQVWEKSDSGHVFLGCISVFLLVYIVFDKIPNFFKKESCCVEVTIGAFDKKKPDSIGIPYSNAIPPKTKYVQLFNTGVKLDLSDKEFDCLSRNIYWESSFEPLLGQMSVANVTYNRVLSGKWGNSFCSVVFAKKQFSWTNSKKLRNATPKNKTQWHRAKQTAMLFANGVRVTNLHKSQFYYADYIKAPKWSKFMNKTAKIGQHIFYAEK